MPYQLSKEKFSRIFGAWAQKFIIFAPKLMAGEGCYDDTDVIRYVQVRSIDEVEWEKRSDYSFKDVLTPINETLFYFTESQTTVPELPEKDFLVLLRSCDLNAVKRLDDIYLKNTFGDFYYARRKEKVKFVLIDCPESCGSGFCVSMGTDKCGDYDAALRFGDESVMLDVKYAPLAEGLKGAEANWSPTGPGGNYEKVTLPKKLSVASYGNPIWKEYGDRCIGCGRCNFVCPSCTCFSMQDIFYRDNPKTGERRRVWASCQVDGFTDIAGGGSFRKDQGERLRFKVMHKVHDFVKRFGYTMCVGCGRCEDVCPEYISYITCLNRLAKEEEE